MCCGSDFDNLVNAITDGGSETQPEVINQCHEEFVGDNDDDDEAVAQKHMLLHDDTTQARQDRT